MQPGIAVTVPLLCRSAFGRNAWVGTTFDPVRERLVGVADKALAAPDESRAAAVLPETLQSPWREVENARGVFFEMYQHLPRLSCSCRLLPMDDSRSVVPGDLLSMI
jgi:hypothetical protein